MTKKVGDSRRRDVLHAGSARPRVPDGDYVVVCYSTRVVRSFGQQRKLVAFFRIVEGDYTGTELTMYCTYPKRKVTASQKLYTQWCLAIGRKPNKNDRLNQRVFLDKMYVVATRKVQRNFKDKTPMPDYMNYSVVDTIKETLTGTSSVSH